MKSVERVKMAIEHREPDRVPRGELGYDPALIHRVLGRAGLKEPDGRKLTTVSKWLDRAELEEFLNRLGIDLVVISSADEAGYWAAHSDFFVFGMVGGVFSDPAYARGLERFLLDCAGDPVGTAELARASAHRNLALAERLITGGAQGVIIADDLAFSGGPFLPPPLLRRVFFPPLSELAGRLRDRGVPVFLHSDGRLTAILDDLVGLGFDGLHSLQPSAGMDLETIKRRYGDRLCLWGNVELDDLLALPDPPSVREAARRAVAAAGPGGGFILSSASGFLRGEIPLEHVLAMYGSPSAP